MNNTNELILIVSVLLTLTMGLSSYLSYRRHKGEELWHQTQFWASLALNVVVLFLFNQSSRFRALGLVGFIWPLSTFKVLLDDISGNKKPVSRWQEFVLLAGGLLTVTLSFFNSWSMIFALPFCLGLSIVGLSFVRSAQSHGSSQEQTPLKWSVYLFSVLYFVKVVLFPFWMSTSLMSLYGFYFDFLLLAGLAGTCLPAYLETKKNQSDILLDEVVKDRNEKLLGQSKFSELGMMSAGIAHEINNPLAVIQARTVQLLRIYNLPEKQKELADGLNQILNTSRRIDRTIQGIREFIHQDDITMNSEIVLKDLVDDVLAFCGQRMKNHGVSLRFYGLENYSVIGNKVQLEQIILNLFNNSFDAIEFLPDKWIELSCHPHGDQIQLFFKDSGHGIPSEISSRMMEPFFSTKEIGKGTGLGLALAQGIAVKHHGNLEYLSDCPHTTFKLELPRYDHDNLSSSSLHH